jgi:hypothetical protein
MQAPDPAWRKFRLFSRRLALRTPIPCRQPFRISFGLRRRICRWNPYTHNLSFAKSHALREIKIARSCAPRDVSIAQQWGFSENRGVARRRWFAGRTRSRNRRVLPTATPASSTNFRNGIPGEPIRVRLVRWRPA